MSIFGLGFWKYSDYFFVFTNSSQKNKIYTIIENNNKIFKYYIPYTRTHISVCMEVCMEGDM